MVWIFLVLGIALLVVGVLLAVVPVLRADHGPRAHGEGGEEAWDVLSQPLEHKHELIKLPKDEPSWMRLVGSKFLQGSFVGAGASLVVVGVVLSYALLSPSRLGTAEAANSTPKAGAPTTPSQTDSTKPAAGDPSKPTTGATATPPTTPKPSGTVAFVVESGQLSQTIATNLKAQNLIPSEAEFLKRLGDRGLETRLQIGSFQIPSGATVDQVIDILTHNA